mgnify:CR=1 FL=1
MARTKTISEERNSAALERSLNLKQLQISRILNITQAINNNVSEEGLYDMYKSFLTWELGVSRMGLFTRKADQWILSSEQGLKGRVQATDLISEFNNFHKISKL